VRARFDARTLFSAALHFNFASPRHFRFTGSQGWLQRSQTVHHVGSSHVGISRSPQVFQHGALQHGDTNIGCTGVSVGSVTYSLRGGLPTFLLLLMPLRLQKSCA